LVDIVGSKGKAGILRLLFGVDAPEIYLREIARRAGLAVRTVHVELARLVKAGLVCARKDGNRIYYRANRENPVYPDIRNLVLKTAGLAEVLRDALQAAEVEIAFVFGSLASSTAGPGSDVDLMLIGPIGLRRVSKLLSGVAAAVGREINPHVMSAEELSKRRRAGDHFVLSVLDSPRLFVIGSERELAKLAK